MAGSESKSLVMENGNPLSSLTESLQVREGVGGYALLADTSFLSVMQSVVRETVPERRVHAHGVALTGYFTARSNEMRKYTKASFLQTAGLTTDVVARFSTTAGGRDSNDVSRELYGLAVRFKTMDANVDFLTINLPVFLIKDAIKFPSRVHSFQPSPRTGIRSPDSALDLLARLPEASGAMMFLYSDMGLPASWRHLQGYGVNVFKLVNQRGEVHYCRWEFEPLAGNKFMTNLQMRKLGLDAKDYFRKDFSKHFASGKVAQWELVLSVVSGEEIAALGPAAFNATVVWPKNHVKRISAGILTLDNFAPDQFSYSDLATFCPGNLCPGIELSQDLLLQQRVFTYRDAGIYRVGINANQLPVNCPMRKIVSINRGGQMNGLVFKDRGYFPNKDDLYAISDANAERSAHEVKDVQIGRIPHFPGPRLMPKSSVACKDSPNKQKRCSDLEQKKSDQYTDIENNQNANAGDFEVPAEDMINFSNEFYMGKLVLESLNPDQRKRLAQNLAEDVSRCTQKVQTQVHQYLSCISKELADDVAELSRQQPQLDVWV